MSNRWAIGAFVALFAITSAAVAYADTSINEMFTQLEQEYGLPSGALGKIANVESGGNPNAGSPGAAYGLFQWLPKSWEYASQALYGRVLDSSVRANPSVSAKVTAFSLAQIKTKNGALIQQANVDMTLGLYLGHFLGPAGGSRFLQAYMQNPNADATALFPREAAANRSVFNGRTLSGVMNELARRLKVAGVNVNVSGNYSDAMGVSYAYSDADISQSNFMPKGYRPTGQDPQRDYPANYSASSYGQQQYATANSVQQAVMSTQVAQTYSNAGTVASSSAIVSAKPSSAINLVAQPIRVSIGDPVLISWTSAGVKSSSCALKQGETTLGTGGEGTSQMQALSAGTLTFDFSCTSNSGEVLHKSTSVDIQ